MRCYGTMYSILSNYHVTYLAYCPFGDHTCLSVVCGIRTTAPEHPAC